MTITDQELIERRGCPECARRKRESELLLAESVKWANKATACQREVDSSHKLSSRLLRLLELMMSFAMKIKVLKLKP